VDEIIKQVFFFTGATVWFLGCVLALGVISGRVKFYHETVDGDDDADQSK
jgi:hypothetical protein